MGTEYTKPAETVADTCGQSDLDCTYVKYAKAAEKSLADGTCASQGYTVKGSTQVKSYPIIGDITITTYSKPATPVKQFFNICSLYEIHGDVCAQSDMNCDYTSDVKFPSM